MVLKRICIRSLAQTARYHYRVFFGVPLMNLVPWNSRLRWLMWVVTSLPRVDGGINVCREVRFLHGLFIESGPFQGAPLLKFITASFIPAHPLPAPFSQGFWLQLPLGGCSTVRQSHGAQHQVFWGAIFVLVIWCDDVSSVTRFPCTGVGSKTGGVRV